MARFLILAVLGATGCANTIDVATSHDFRTKPFDTMFHREDPLATLRTSPEGDKRAKAMRAIADGGTPRSPDEYEEIMRYLTQAATTDASPVVRVAAIDALGKLRDERSVQVLTAAYDSATGTVKPAAESSRLPLLGPSGFPPEMVTMIRSRVADSLALTNKPEAVPMLQRIATTDDETADRDVRLAAVRGLAKVRHPDSAVALARVLAGEKGKDPALSGRAHEGLVSLTGMNLPADAQAWTAQVQQAGGVRIVPEPGGVEQAIRWATDR